MSRLFSPRGVCAKCALLAARGPPPLASRAKQPRFSERVFIHQQTRRVGGSNATFSKHASKPAVWIRGVALAVALAVGLKCRKDAITGGSCCDGTQDARGRAERYGDAIKVSRELVERIKAEVGAPGLVVGVSVDGAEVWSEGIGYADLENRVPCGPETVMRIASISKPLTSAAAARLCEEGKLELDVPVQKYVPEFPQKRFNGRAVTITPRMILSHLSGIRHYEKDARKVKESREKARGLLKPAEEEEEKSSSENKDSTEPNDKGKEGTREKKREFEHEEYYLKDHFESVTEALDLFKDDPLIFKPGTTFLYSTHAFTLLSAAMERAAGQPFLDVMMTMFHELGMLNTVPDKNDPIIYHRSRFYQLNKRGRVVNCPYVDNSYKWAGGGFLSTVGDLLLFGNALLYSYQLARVQDAAGRLLLPGFLKPQTAVDLWSPVERTEASWDKDGRYAQGWLVVESLQKYGQCRKRRHYVSHTGGAVGASSVLLVLPGEEAAHEDDEGRDPRVPRGVVVTIVTNMQSVGLNGTALKIAQEFDAARSVWE